MIDISTEKVDLFTFMMDLQTVGEPRIAGEMVEIIVEDRNSYESSFTDYDDLGAPFVNYVTHKERIPVVPLKKTIYPAGTVYNDQVLEADLVVLEDKGTEVLITEAKEKARKIFAAFYAAKNLQKDLPNGTTIYEGTA